MTDETTLQDGFVSPGSISFGRFDKESLSWERRSPFSRNRYLEEAEKCASPGSVTQRTAFFEAHFKQKGLPDHVSVDSQNGAVDRLNETSNPDSQNSLEDFDHVHNPQHAWFDEASNDSNENNLKAELQLCDFERTLERESAEVVASLLVDFNAVSARFDFVMEENVGSPSASLVNHQILDKCDPLLSSEDDKYLEGGHVHFPKPEDTAELVEKSDSSKHHVENVEFCDADPDETRQSNCKVRSATSSTRSKMDRRLAQNQNPSMSGPRVAMGKPSGESNAWKAEKSRETISRRETELFSSTTKHKVQPGKASSSSRNGAKQELTIPESAARCSASGIPKGRKNLPSRRSPRKMHSFLTNGKSERTELMKAKPHQEHRRGNPDEDLNNRRVPDACHPNRTKQDLKDPITKSRPKHGVTSSKMDSKGISNFRSDERAETKKVGRLARPPSASLGMKPTGSSSSSASKEGSSRISQTVDTTNSIDKTSSGTAATSIKSEPDNRCRISLANRNAESRQRNNAASQSVPQRPALVKATQGGKTRSRVLKSQAKPIKSLVSSSSIGDSLVIAIAS